MKGGEAYGEGGQAPCGEFPPPEPASPWGSCDLSLFSTVNWPELKSRDLQVESPSITLG